MKFLIDEDSVLQFCKIKPKTRNIKFKPDLLIALHVTDRMMEWRIVRCVMYVLWADEWNANLQIRNLYHRKNMWMAKRLWKWQNLGHLCGRLRLTNYALAMINFDRFLTTAKLKVCDKNDGCWCNCNYSNYVRRKQSFASAAVGIANAIHFISSYCQRHSFYSESI